jgi:hypothetical protein
MVASDVIFSLIYQTCKIKGDVHETSMGKKIKTDNYIICIAKDRCIDK